MKKKKIIRQPSEDALNLLLKHEVGGGKNYYDKFLSGFTWPGAFSGPTIAIGIDCGYYSREELRQIFNFLNEDEIMLIQNASGKTGLEGKEYTKVLKKANIKVSWDKAIEIFTNTTWPKFSNLAEKVYPELNQLCDNAYGAIVSLIFNRGASLNGSRRLEMQNIKKLIPEKKYKNIANEIRKMKRLWVGSKVNGLLKRRDDEAALVETCLKSPKK